MTYIYIHINLKLNLILYLNDIYRHTHTNTYGMSDSVDELRQQCYKDKNSL